MLPTKTSPSTHAPTPAIFEVNTSRLASIQNLFLHGAYTLRKGGQRILQVGQILSKTGIQGPPPISGRVRRATREASKNKVLTPTEKERLEQMVISRQQNSGIDLVKRNGMDCCHQASPPTGHQYIMDPRSHSNSHPTITPKHPPAN